MNLKGRLELIAHKVPPCTGICDIGTDHGYIPIHLIQAGRCKVAIASDVKQGPIQAAMENIKAAGLQDVISARLGDGLTPIEPSEVDVVVIAGMGGTLMKTILEEDLEKAKSANLLVLQPMNAIDELRQWLYEKGFEILDEELTCEGQKIYDVLSVKWTDSHIMPEEIYLHVGKALVEKKDPLLGKYVLKKANQIQKILMGLKEKGDLEGARLENYQRLLKGHLRILKEINSGS